MGRSRFVGSRSRTTSRQRARTSPSGEQSDTNIESKDDSNGVSLTTRQPVRNQATRNRSRPVSRSRTRVRNRSRARTRPVANESTVANASQSSSLDPNELTQEPKNQEPKESPRSGINSPGGRSRRRRI